MKAFLDIEKPKDIIEWDTLDFTLSCATYSAQELSDLKAMIGICKKELNEWAKVTTNDFFDTFSARTFSPLDEKDVERLSVLVSVQHLMLDLELKGRIAAHYSAKLIPDCFLN